MGNLHAFARADKGGPAPPVDVEKAITSALGIAENEIRHRLRLERDHEPGLGVAADEGQLVQVLVNVLVNAAQAAPAGAPSPYITVRTRRFDARVEIIVADTGVGIPSAILPRPKFLYH